jgi:hypothetical protein
VFFCGFKMFEASKPSGHFKLRDEDGLELTNAINEIFVQLPEIRRRPRQTDGRDDRHGDVGAVFFLGRQAGAFGSGKRNNQKTGGDQSG